MKLRTALLGAAAAFALAPAAHAERGVDGELKLTFPQAVSIMNPYLSGGTKDIIASQFVLEALAGLTPQGEIVPKLAVEIPTLENGGISEDRTSITWKLQPGLVWSDGTPVTADDAVFTAAYCMDPAGGCGQATKYEGVVSVEALTPPPSRSLSTDPNPTPTTPLSARSRRSCRRRSSRPARGPQRPPAPMPTTCPSAPARSW